MQGRKGYYRLIDCPPRPGTWRPKGRTCGTHYYCPFCWVREVLEPNYSRFLGAIYGTTKPTARSKRLLNPDVVEIHNRTYVDIETDLADLSVQSLDEARMFYDKLIDPAGMLYLTTWEPFDASTIQVHTRQLLLVPPGTSVQSLSVSTSSDVSFLRCANDEVSVESICLAVASCCEYPSALLYGNTEVSVQILNARHRKIKRGEGKLAPLSAIYGRLRDLAFVDQNQRYNAALKEALA